MSKLSVFNGMILLNASDTLSALCPFIIKAFFPSSRYSPQSDEILHTTGVPLDRLSTTFVGNPAFA